MFKLIIFGAIALHIFNVPSVAPMYMIFGFLWLMAWALGAMLGGAVCSVARTCRK